MEKRQLEFEDSYWRASPWGERLEVPPEGQHRQKVHLNWMLGDDPERHAFGLSLLEKRDAT